MDIIADSNNEPDSIRRIAVCLADNFVKPLYNCCTEKNYYVYIGILTEIINWAHEFYEQYHDKLNDWEAFKKSGDNIHNAATGHEFLVAWGKARVNKFLNVNTKGYPGNNENSKTGIIIKAFNY